MLATDKTIDKSRLTVHLTPDVDEKVRIFAVKHRKNLSELTEAMILHCLGDKKFLNSLKKEEAIPY